MKSQSALAAAAVCVLIASCSPKSIVLPTDPGKLPDISAKLKGLSDGDRALLAGFYMRHTIGAAFSGGKDAGIAPGTTVGKAIEEQKQFQRDQERQEAEAQALKQKLAAQRAAAEATMNNAVLVALANKSFVPSNAMAGRYEDRIDLIIDVKNKSGKDISGIKGSFEFLDMFGSKVSDLNISMDDGLGPSEEKQLTNYSKPYNQFESDDQKLANTDMSKLKAIFHPEMIVFSDGTKLIAPEEPAS